MHGEAERFNGRQIGAVTVGSEAVSTVQCLEVCVERSPAAARAASSPSQYPPPQH